MIDHLLEHTKRICIGFVALVVAVIIFRLVGAVLHMIVVSPPPPQVTGCVMVVFMAWLLGCILCEGIK